MYFVVILPHCLLSVAHAADSFHVSSVYILGVKRLFALNNMKLVKYYVNVVVRLQWP